MKSLSKREKILILIAGIIAGSFLIFNFILIPTYNRYIKSLEEYNEISSQQKLTEMKLSNEALTRQAYDSAEVIVAQKKTLFPLVMTNEELDRLITGMCLKNNLKPTLLGMSVIKRVAETTVPSAETPGDPAEELEDLGVAQREEAIAKAEADGEEAPTIFTVATANINANGSYGDLQNLIDEIERSTYIRISSVDYSGSKEKLTTTEAKAPAISIVFEVTMLDESKIK